jgi:hypothetical protein
MCVRACVRAWRRRRGPAAGGASCARTCITHRIARSLERPTAACGGASAAAAAMGRVEEEEGEEQGELYVVRKVKDLRRNKQTKRWEFFVRWKGYPNEDNTWEGPQAFSDPSLYQPLLNKLSKLRKATLAEEGPALKALRNARWDLEEALASMAAYAPKAAKKPAQSSKEAPKAAQQPAHSRAEAPIAAHAAKAAKKRAAPADKGPHQPARKLPTPSGGATAAAPAAAPDTIEPSSAAAPAVTASASSGAAEVTAGTTIRTAEEEEWLKMLVRREEKRAPVPYAEVDFIRDQQQKKAGGKLVPAYLVHWRGADPMDDTWVVATRVKKAPRGPEAIKAFEQAGAGAQAAPVTQEKQHASQPASLKVRPATETASSGTATNTVTAVEQPAAVPDRAERATGTSQKHKRDTAEAGAAQPKKQKSDTPPLAAVAAAASGIERPVELRTGLQISQMNADHRELLDEFEQWQLTGQVKPPTEKTCKKYFQKFKKFLHTDYESYDISAKWNLCNKKKHDALIRRVKGSAKNKKDHGECSACLNKFIMFLQARAHGWTSSAPVATLAGDVSDRTRAVRSHEQAQAKPQTSKQLAKETTEKQKAKATMEKQKASSKKAEDAKKTKEELQQLLEKNRLREKKIQAKKAKKAAKRKDRHDDGQGHQPSSVARHDKTASKSLSSTASVSATEMERLHARMTSLPDTAAQPKLGAIPKKRRPAAAADSTDRFLEWQGIPVECGLCKSGITVGRACRGAMVDGRIFCNTCLPAECRPNRDAWAKVHLSGNAADVPRQPADERSAEHRPGSRPGSGASDDRSLRDSRVAPPRAMNSSRLCKFFNTPRGCFRGESCRFRHDQCEQPEVVSQSSEPARVARYAPGQHPDQIPHGQQHRAAQRYAAEQQEGNGSSPADQIPQGAVQATAFNTYDYGRDERTNRDTTKTQQVWNVIMLTDTVRRMDAMDKFPRGVLNHVISWKLSEALANR